LSRSRKTCRASSKRGVVVVQIVADDQITAIGNPTRDGKRRIDNDRFFHGPRVRANGRYPSTVFRKRYRRLTHTVPARTENSKITARPAGHYPVTVEKRVFVEREISASPPHSRMTKRPIHI